MPTYQYVCTACGARHEAVQSFSDAPLTDCPACAGALRKVFSAVGVVFKGSGFYKNDSRAGTGGSSKADADASAGTSSGDASGGGAPGGGKEAPAAASGDTNGAPKTPAKTPATTSGSGSAGTTSTSTPASKSA